LRELEIATCPLFNQDTANAMAAGLCANQSLEILKLQWSVCIAAFDGAQWRQMLEQNQTLKVLSLCTYDVYIDRKRELVLPSFSRGLATTTLQTLSLSLVTCYIC